MSAAAKVRAGWGERRPDWIDALAAACDAASQARVAPRLGYSAATLSYVLAGSYKGDVAAVERRVRDTLMRRTVTCPVQGAIGGDDCVRNQSLPYSCHNPQRVALYRACRSGCPHSRLTEETR